MNRSRYTFHLLSSRKKILPFFVLLIEESPLLLNITPRKPFKSNFSAGRVGAYCIRPTKRPAKGGGVDVESIRGVCFCALPGYMSDNQLDMKKRNTYLSTIVPNITSHQPFKSNFSAGRVEAYCIRPTKRLARGERVDVESIWCVFNTPLHGYLSDNRLDMEE